MSEIRERKKWRSRKDAGLNEKPLRVERGVGGPTKKEKPWVEAEANI